MAKQSIFKDTRLTVYLVLFIISFAAATLPISVPVPISPWVQEFYDHIEALPEGSIVYIPSFISSGNVADMSEGILITMRHLIAKNMKLIVYEQRADAVIFREKFLQELYGAPVNANPLYGESLVCLGYLPGEAAVYEEHKYDMWGYSPTDAYGTPLEDLPMTKDIISVKDSVDLIVGWDARGLESAFVIPLGTLVLEVSVTMAAGYLGAQYTAGFFKGMIYGQRNAAEYAVISGLPSNAGAFATSLVLVTIYLIVGLIAVNIDYFMKRKKEVI